jgi:hypothetical protein
MGALPVHVMSFDGELLARGFWVYVCKVTHPNGVCLYVGQTGDAAYAKAQSPFNRVGGHLDLRERAKANTLTKQLNVRGIDPLSCSFELVAVGPIHPEQPCKKDHRACWGDVVAAERELARFLQQRGYDVVGESYYKAGGDRVIVNQLLDAFEKRFPKVEKAATETGTQPVLEDHKS